MKKLNHNGFTLVEVLAVVIILSLLLAFAIPNVYHLINEGKEKSLESIENFILTGAKNYVSDYRYDIVVDGTCSNGGIVNVQSIRGVYITNGIKVKDLVDMKYVQSKNDRIINPKDGTTLDLDNSFVKVQFDCGKKDYVFEIADNGLIWN